MKTAAGLWIDHRRAVVVLVTPGAEKTLEIRSHFEKQPGRIDGERSLAPFEALAVPSDGRRERIFTDHIDRFYAEVEASLQAADSVLIFGPGEAKGELRKRLLQGKVDGRVIAVETRDKMTDRQIVAKVREHFFPTQLSPTPEPKERS